MKTILLIFALLFISSCATRQEKAFNYYQKNKGELAQLCVAEFPNDTLKIIKGETKITTDTVFSTQTVKVPCPPAEPGKVVFAECPPAQTVYKTITRTDTIVITDTQKTKALEFSLTTKQDELKTCQNLATKLQTDFDTMKRQKNRLLWFLIFLATLGLGYGFLKIYKPFR